MLRWAGWNEGRPSGRWAVDAAAGSAGARASGVPATLLGLHHGLATSSCDPLRDFLQTFLF